MPQFFVYSLNKQQGYHIPIEYLLFLFNFLTIILI